MVGTEASDLQLGMCDRRDDILFCTHYSGMRKLPGYDHSQAYQLGIYLDLIRHFLGQGWVPDEIGIEGPRASAAARELFPGSRIRVQRPVGYIAVPRTRLHWSARRTCRKAIHRRVWQPPS